MLNKCMMLLFTAVCSLYSMGQGTSTTFSGFLKIKGEVLTDPKVDAEVCVQIFSEKGKLIRNLTLNRGKFTLILEKNVVLYLRASHGEASKIIKISTVGAESDHKSYLFRAELDLAGMSKKELREPNRIVGTIYYDTRIDAIQFNKSSNGKATLEIERMLQESSKACACQDAEAGERQDERH